MSARPGFYGIIDEVNAAGLFVCIGLDSELGRLPSAVAGPLPQFEFNRRIIDATADLAAAYKPNSAFYEAQGAAGFDALARTIEHIRVAAPQALVILDCKRGDIGSTNRGYAEAAFQMLGADVITIHPYLGVEAMREFLVDPQVGAFILCRTSNPGAGEFQDLRIATETGDRPLFELVAENVRRDWNEHRNCGLVVGATYPEELATIRSLAPELPFLIPGIGAQGGDLRATVESSGMRSGAPTIINSSRGIIFASTGSDFAEAARSATEMLNAQISHLVRN
jgi:orotidine-5'-phosphate decarboxylase